MFCSETLHLKADALRKCNRLINKKTVQGRKKKCFHSLNINEFSK